LKILLATLLLLCHYGIAIHSHAQASFFDPTFGVGGKTIINHSGIVDGIFEAVTIQPDGKIVVAGILNSKATIGRLKVNGTPDSLFAINGFYVYNTIGSLFNDVAIQPDGKILAAGTNDDMFLTVRLNSNGTPDATFGSGGVATTYFGMFAGARGYALVLQSDGKIVIGGEKDANMGIARLHNNGMPDSSFGTNGLIVGPNGRIRGIGLTPDGKIVVGGHASAAHNYALMAVRYLANGTLDTTFNHTGIVYTIAGEPRGNFGKALKVQPDGKVLLVGSGSFGAEGSNMVVVRYNNDGSLDDWFGSGGVVVVDFYGQDEEATDLRIAPDGKILLAGNIGVDVDYVVTRLKSNGSVDFMFGSAGRMIVPVRDSRDYASAVELQPDGKIVVAGRCSVPSATGTGTNPAIVRLSSYPASIGTETYDNDVVLFPNPVSGVLHIRHRIGNVLTAIWAVDMMGRKTYISKVGINDQIDVSDLSEGIYIFRVIYADGQEIDYKMQVQH
jgi:uncharacterized delta-60 repeat protein